MTPSVAFARFDLAAEIEMSELCSEETLAARLHEHPALRLRLRNNILAVLVTPKRWKEILQTIRDLEDTVECYEQAAVQDVIAERAAKAHFAPATKATWNEVVQRFNDLTP